MKKLLLYAIVLTISIQSYGQISYGGEPSDWDIKEIDAFNIPFITTDAYDLEKLQSEDAVTDAFKSTPYRFGVDHELNRDFFEMAQVTVKSDGTEVYRLGIHCPEATSISLLVDDFFIPEGGQLFLWNDDRTKFIGSFTHESNKENRVFPIGLLHDDHIVMEYVKTPETEASAALHLATIHHGYRTILNKWETERGPFGNSQSCNINVACPEGDPYEDQISSVALIVQGSFAVCTGSMMANTSGDDTPYFLTADHCLGNPASWTYYFNHESSSCNGSNGPVGMSISNGSLLEDNGGSDMAFIELSSPPPASWNIFYNGWNTSTAQNIANSAYGIHHPSGDVKKICIEEDNPVFQNSGGVATWYISRWDAGVTEGGSSGSPLYNQDGHVIGQLFGGQASCSNNADNNSSNDWDVYGRFGVSYPFLEDWLDPIGQNPTSFDGYYPSVTDVIEERDVMEIGLVPNPAEDQVTISIAEDELVDLFIMDASGKVVLSGRYQMNGPLQLDIDELESGVYIISMYSQSFVGSKRFVKS